MLKKKEGSGPKKSKIFAIGDIHGCKNELLQLWQTLLHDAKLKPERDTVVFMGDYVDRGPDTKGVIEFLMNLEEIYPHFVFLYGNHEDLMLDALLYKGQIYHSYDLWYNQGGLQTAQSYFPPGFSKYDMAVSQPKDHIRWRHLDWLRKRPLYFETEDYFFVHAGVPPHLTLEEMKSNLDKGSLTDKTREDALWIRDEFIFSKKDWGKKVIFGHTADGDGRYTRPPGG